MSIDDLADLLHDHSRAPMKVDDATTGCAVTVYDDDGFAAAGADGERNLLKGELLKFVDGAWTQAGTRVPAGTQYVPEKVFKVWVRWQEGKPFDYVWPRPSGMLPHRDTLGHTDQRDWPAGIDGEPSDPWRNTRYFHLINPATAETVTFTNSTAGARHCYEELGSAVTTMRKVHPRALPVLELSSVPMKTKFGQKQRPHFKIAGWRCLGGSAAPQIEAKPDDMNDDLPF